MRTLAVGEQCSPLLTLVEAYRMKCAVPVGVLAEVAGISRLTYYGWLRGASTPKSSSEYELKRVGAAMKACLAHKELPVVTRSDLTKKARDATIKSILEARSGVPAKKSQEAQVPEETEGAAPEADESADE